ncbi:uncharacterized protein At2g39910 isoform X2 [Primulina huaijiensis]|uniref:uncharacterized protein At2g39910 isoform X2 n=1 Tax=Primulina huaijiensis TaxID=1492673 RepID=UPI003CC75499
MANSQTFTLPQNLVRLYETLNGALAKTPYDPPEATAKISIKSELQSLLPNLDTLNSQIPSLKIRDVALCCAALASALESTTKHLSWVPNSLSTLVLSVFQEFSDTYCHGNDNCSLEVADSELDLRGLKNEKKLVIKLIPEVLPFLKGKIKESAIDTSNEDDRISAASASVPVAYAIVAAYQFRWFVTQVESPHLGKLSPLVIPCALTALDHWSPEVKDQGMISFIHLAKNVNAAEIGGYTDVLLDACCQNVACDDEIWHYLVEMSVLLVTLTQRSNPRSLWFEKLLSEMLNHLERQPRNKQRRTAWLTHIEPMFSALGLILVAHFRRLFPLFFKWMHADDDDTVLLVLERIKTILKVTWIRNTPHVERLVDELVTLYKDAAMKVAREDIRSHILQVLTMIRQSKSSQFNTTWVKYKDDPNLTALQPSLTEGDAAAVA